MFGGFTFARSSMMPIFKALIGWALLEVREGWRTWLARRQSQVQVPSGEPEVPTVGAPVRSES
jgi:hypothetical protein